ncbi:anti-sigma-factor antagonist [Thermincola ferriacetica]|uniref:Anti-sigma F factor antagonist n=2 Tax=Thermincola TaxID=278993 RepID=D5X7D7_THEPJ|nr:MULTISPECIES: anti-sigma F factor antagonist [Thermincola]ADG82507.1 anti-sigma-factor antagonist [Thermincola potens JR]KNZ70781.1 anti-sigma-factor antagonist [Thermincola ferriacetica]
MCISSEYKESVLLVKLTGDFDMAVADNIRCHIDKQLDEGLVKNVVLDLSDVGFIDSSGLGVILGRYKRISQLGGKMAIIGAQPQVNRILELSGIQKIIDCYSAEEEALQAM